MSYVKFLDFSKLYTSYQEDVDAVIKRSLLNGKLILQEDVEEFEEKLAKYLGVRHVIGVASGTDALLLSLRACDIGPGDEVITVSNTFIATIQVIVQLGAKPVLVDVEDNGLISGYEVSRALTSRTKAVIPVHLGGDVSKKNWLQNATQGITLIEDAAQAVGAEGVGYGLTQCYSFYPAKILGCYGDGGAVATNDDKIAARIRSLRNHGGVTKYSQKTYEYGYNSRLDNIQAAVLNVKLEKLDEDLETRRLIAEKYLRELDKLPLILPNDSMGRVWQDFTIMPSDRHGLNKHLKDNGIETLGVGLETNHSHKGLGLDFNLPKTDAHVRQSMRLPCNQFMTEDDTNYVIKEIKSYYA